ncbi:hypothetical protein AJ85_18365 [Alkalihalobacillus alcalophilus ATCC 27647 = CGMCC 1.3604]|uniref:PsbP C-terminal domain-containing protein n=1 Tax=Alkalihalobacillus alcalophilus ATCC 27647 = CGMCC 1.3604 TaxID=1218173 RepID=A0A094WLX5_ALKAL|nr:hypothetical protein [Alkalihalobacillus alcalophilus]KGA98724.1 hypothetical protein BALCAV_0202935 [Alkalihalobacillus alcalophilus ATCC 27647 = CGMCC 1.3604]MED1563297.1 hypothetical protein [Alkalihalobacillus alcalophilus]THG89329.1 hypothetical protein AJ85_18365 [Alkalihalobacillus alcalophilus ATCC 27647 = CGMCC 1.3604]
MWDKRLLVAAFLLSLVACNVEVENDNEQKDIVEPPLTEVNESEESNNGGESSEEEVELPAEENGGIESEPGGYFNSELGYQIYVLEDYTFTLEEPRTDQIYHNTQSGYFLRIVDNGKNADFTKMEETLLEHSQGAITAYDIEFNDVEYAYVEHYQSEEGDAYIYHLAKKYEETVVSYTIFLPQGDDMEEIKEDFIKMIETVQFD